MNLYQTIAERRATETKRPVFGVVVGVVTNNQDPDGFGRVKVRFPWLTDEDESHWARVAAPMAGKEMGAFFLPEVEDEVLVAFEHGDVRLPYVVGCLWNGQDAPPEKNDDGKNNMRVIKSRSGHQLRFNDEEGSETVEIIDGSGKNSLLIDMNNGLIRITVDKDIELSCPQGKLAVESSELELKSSGDATVEASGTLTLKGSTVNIN